MRDDLGLERRVLPRCPIVHERAPLLHALLRLLQEPAVASLLEEREQLAKRGLRIARKADFHRKAKSDASRIAVDLNPARLLVLRIELQVRKARPDHEQRIALFRRQLRGERPEEADTAGGVR